MAPLLFLCHRLPYPPNKGDKIRSFHILKHLAKRWRVHLVTFIDDDNDLQYVPEVEKICASVHVKRIAPMRGKIKALLGLLLGDSFSDSFYRFKSVQAHVDTLIKEHRISTAFCYSTPMARYIDAYPSLARYMDFVDMDSYKWKQYANTHKIPMKWVFATEFKRLLNRERATANTFQKSWFVTAEERELFLREVGQTVRPDKVDWFSNGVDLEYFKPDPAHSSPFEATEQAIVFTGAMDYYANADAVEWFADEVWPPLKKKHPHLKFYIVGSKPLDRVKALAARDGIIVTGRVLDVRPYLQHAALAVAPMRIARGLQNKVLEALAMNRAIVSTPEALEGLVKDPQLNVLSAASSAVFVEKCNTMLGNSAQWRDYVVQHYQWEHNLSALACMDVRQ